LEYRARTNGDEILVSIGAHRLTAAETDRAANRIAHAFLASGLEEGERVAVLAKNCIELLVLYYAASKVGVVLVPLNYRLTPPEWKYILLDAGVRTIVAEPEFAAQLDSLDDGPALFDDRVLTTGEMPGWTSWGDWTSGQSEARPDRSPSTDSVLYQMYTSGTTGRPKGAVLSQSAVCSNIIQEIPVFAIQPGDRVLLSAPLFHSAGAILSFSAIAMGGSVIIQREFDAEAVVEAMSSQSIAVTLLVPAMIQFCLAVPGARERNFDGLRRIAYGASPISRSVLKDAMEVFGCEFAQGYGLTETTSLATALLPADHARALASEPDLLLSCGRAAMGTEVRVVNEKGREVPRGEAGEILVRGPQMFREYWNLPAATEEALRDGWLHTGDGGVMDEEGFLYLKDRIKDMIISGGENIYPREVEEVLFQHDAIADVAVVGIPHEHWGETVMAVVVPTTGCELDENEVIEFCRSRLAGYKRPRSVDIVDEIPRNTSGKVLKRELRERYLHSSGREPGPSHV